MEQNALTITLQRISEILTHLQRMDDEHLQCADGELKSLSESLERVENEIARIMDTTSKDEEKSANEGQPCESELIQEEALPHPQHSEKGIAPTSTDRTADGTTDVAELTPTIDNVSKLSRTTDRSSIANNPLQLPNATIETAYSAELSGLGIISAREVIPTRGDHTLESIGLKFNESDNTIDGTPSNEGTYDFIVKTILEDSNRPAINQEYRIQISIIPNPRALWKSLEPPEDAIYQKKHFDYLEFREKGNHVLAASIRGRSHAHSGTFRDDDFIVKHKPFNDSQSVWLFGVADGAGSCEFARKGSALACNTLGEFIWEKEEEFTNLLQLTKRFMLEQENEQVSKEFNVAAYTTIGEMVLKAKQAIQNEASSKNFAVKDFSTTLLFTLALEYDRSNYVLLSYGIGDGAIAHVKEDSIKILNRPDGGAYAGQTRFLTMDEATRELNDRMTVYGPVESIAGLYLMTDGITDHYFQTDHNLQSPEHWHSLQNDLNDKDYSNPKSIASELEELLSFWSRGNHDDRTMIWVQPNEEPNK